RRPNDVHQNHLRISLRWASRTLGGLPLACAKRTERGTRTLSYGRLSSEATWRFLRKKSIAPLIPATTASNELRTLDPFSEIRASGEGSRAMTALQHRNIRFLFRPTSLNPKGANSAARSSNFWFRSKSPLHVHALNNWTVSSSTPR